MSLVGLRVLRGPDWCHGDIDGGNGHIGTIVNIEGLNTADVVWDNGNQCVCRIGVKDKHDLKIYDSGPVGICHTEFACSSCSECGILGIRWQCTQCSDVNLCSVCYVTDKHDINHSFLRFDTSQSQGTFVLKRDSCLRCQSSGMFVGAIVKRGRDWNYDNQDGGSGKSGKVIGIDDAGSSTARNILRVKWKSTGETHSYRLGGTDGKVDLMFVEQSRGSCYYPDHLPSVCGQVGHKNCMRTFAIYPACFIPAPGETEEPTSKPRGKIFSGARPSVSSMGLEVLFYAIHDGSLNMVQQLLDANPELVEAWYSNITPLTLASNIGTRDIVLELLERGADINRINQGGDTPLTTAIDGYRPAIVKLLIQKGADVNAATEDGLTALQFAILMDEVEIFELLLQKGCELNQQDKDGQTPLHIAAASKQSYKVLSFLCKQPNIKIELKNNDGCNAVHYACMFGNTRAVDMILERNRNLLTSPADGGLTELRLAVQNQNLECCKLLIEKYKADVNCQTNKGETPLYSAMFELNIDLVKYLLEKNADLNIAEPIFKSTPLHACCMYNLTGSGQTGIRLQIAKCLLDNGASTSQRDILGLTPIERCTDATMKVSLIGMIRHRKSTKAEKKKGLETLADRMHLPCTKCFKRPNEAILLPCFHKCLCEECCRETRVCTLCNKSIKETVLQKNCWTG